jgi:hypothetical protein
MPVGVALVDLRRDLRAETGQSLNPAQNVQSQQSQDIQLDRQQRELWDAYQWPHLRYWVDVPLSQNQALYDYPEEMPFDQINRIFYSDGTSSWKILAYGLHAFDIQPGTPQSGTPLRWGNKVAVVDGKTNPVGQLQLVPTPAQSGTLRFEGQAPCNPLIADDDKCVIDSKAIVLFAAAEILATQKVEAAALKLTKAQNYLRKLLANSGADKRANYNMGGNNRIDHFGARPYRGYVPGIDYIP